MDLEKKKNNKEIVKKSYWSYCFYVKLCINPILLDPPLQPFLFLIDINNML